MSAQGSHREIVELFMDFGADIHLCDKEGRTLLHHASEKGFLEIVKGLVDKQVDINAKDFHGLTPLILAAQRSHKEVVDLLINCGADIHCRDKIGRNVLHHASMGGSVEIVQCLVNKGFDLNMQSFLYDETPLLKAAQYRNKEVVELLIKSGANIHFCYDGDTLLHYASEYGWVEMVHYLVSKEFALDIESCINRKTPLVLAARNGHKEVVELLIKSGADIHICSGGETLLHRASEHGWLEIVQYLIHKEVALDIKFFLMFGETPLMLAAQYEHKEVVELLIKSGAKVRRINHRGETALHCASEGGCIEIVQLLLKGGADLNGKDSRGATPLLSAVEMNKVKMADYLLKEGANCNLEDISGKSPFSYLISKEKHVEIIKLCIEKGAYVKSSDNDNMLKKPSLKKAILQDVKLCSQAVINKFNNLDLTLLYKRLASGQKLPKIDKMKIGEGSGAALEVEQAVSREMQVKGYCDLSRVVPMSLKIVCVKSFIERSRPPFNREKPSGSHNAMKRLGVQQEYPCKKNM